LSARRLFDGLGCHPAQFELMPMVTESFGNYMVKERNASRCSQAEINPS